MPFIFDEINVVPNRVLMRIKTDLNARVGQEVTIQEDGDQRIKVGDKFAVGATANVKSEKYADREKLDPALVRMFESVVVDYFPPEELYDIMLASMMDVRGGIKISLSDAMTTLKGLADATEWIQKAYLGKEVRTVAGNTLAARGQESIGKPATLREAILDPGKALDMLVGWEDSQKEGLTFREFLNQKIIAFINNENFPEEDRYYLTEIFALQGFLQGVPDSQLRVNGLDPANMDSWNGWDGKRHVSKINYIPPEVVAKLDPYGTLNGPVSLEASDLLEESIIEEVEEKPYAATPTTTSARTPNNTPPGRFANRSISTEGAIKITNLDIMYPVSTLNSLDSQTKFAFYPDRLIEIAESDKTTYLDVLKRLDSILDGSLSSGEVDMMLRKVLRLAELANTNNYSISAELASLVNKINSQPKWKTGVFAEEIRTGLRNIQAEILK